MMTDITGVPPAQSDYEEEIVTARLQEFGALAMGSGYSGAGNTGGMALQALMGTGIMGG